MPFVTPTRWPVMSALGQKQTLGHLRLMSALPPKADITAAQTNVRFVPKADVSNRSKAARYSITSSARMSSVGGMVIRSALAVWRLIIVLNLVDRSIGSSPGFALFKILSTKAAARFKLWAAWRTN